LQPLLGKYMWLCMELKKNIALDQAEFQSMVSGEDVSVAVKNEVAKQTKWDLPGLLCGNESPHWIDAQGSIARRMVIINFPFSVQEKHASPELLTRILQQELPSIIAKTNIAYRRTCAENAFCDIWKILPSYFKMERLRLQKDTDAVYAAVYDATMFELFIEKEAADESLKMSWYMPFSLLELHYRQKWRDIQASSSPDPFTAEKYAPVFESAGLSAGSAVLWYHNEQTKDVYVFGIRARRPLASPGAPFWQP
jgi:hypothetical protein